LGRVAVSARVWDKRGPLSAAQWEQVRLHPYVTERVLARSTGLAAVAAVAGGHHERADGSGDHRGGPPGRVRPLLATPAVQPALGEPRPHRPALAPAGRARVLRDERAAGRLPGWAVDAVLGTAGYRPAAVPGASPLTDREREVLVLVARG